MRARGERQRGIRDLVWSASAGARVVTARTPPPPAGRCAGCCGACGGEEATTARAVVGAGPLIVTSPKPKLPASSPHLGKAKPPPPPRRIRLGFPPRLLRVHSPLRKEGVLPHRARPGRPHCPRPSNEWARLGRLVVSNGSDSAHIGPRAPLVERSADCAAPLFVTCGDQSAPAMSGSALSQTCGS